MFEAYYKAVERERSLRESAFGNATRCVCGVEVRMLTLSDLLRFRSTGSPFFLGGFRTEADAVEFLEGLSTQFAVTRGIRKSIVRTGIRAMVAFIGLEQALSEIDAFIEEMFMDSPVASISKRKGSPAPKVSEAASWVDWAASEYGWSEEAILTMPLPRLFQYDRQSSLRKNSSTVLFNKFSDREKTKYIEAKNARRKND